MLHTDLVREDKTGMDYARFVRSGPGSGAIRGLVDLRGNVEKFGDCFLNLHVRRWAIDDGGVSRQVLEQEMVFACPLHGLFKSAKLGTLTTTRG